MSPQSCMMRFYLRNVLLQEDLLPHPGPVASHTPTFEVINIARMPPAYQLEYNGEDLPASSPHKSASATAAPPASPDAPASVSRGSKGAAAAACSSKEAGTREGNKTEGARSPPIVSGALVFGAAALGTALAATLFLCKNSTVLSSSGSRILVRGGELGQNFIHEFLSSPVLQWRRQNFGWGGGENSAKMYS